MNKVPVLPLQHAATFDSSNKSSTERPCLRPPRPPTKRLNKLFLENTGPKEQFKPNMPTNFILAGDIPIPENPSPLGSEERKILQDITNVLN